MRARSASGSVDSPRAVEPTRSQKRTVTTLRCSRLDRGRESCRMRCRSVRRRRSRARSSGRPPCGGVYERTGWSSESSMSAASVAANAGRSGRRRPRAPMPRRQQPRRGSSRRAHARRPARRETARGERRPSRRRRPARQRGANARMRRVFFPKRMSAKHPFSSVMRTFRGPISAIASRAMRKSSSSSSSWPTSCSASRWFGETRNGPASTPRRSGSPSESSTTRTSRAFELADRVRIERRRDLARKRSGEHDEVGAAREVVQLLRAASRAHPP